MHVSKTSEAISELETCTGERLGPRAGGASRALDWLCLVPGAGRMVIEPSVPDGIKALLRWWEHPAGETLIAHRHPESIERLSSFQSVVVFNPDGGIAARLISLGFDQSLAFVAVPSLVRPRVLISLGGRRVTLGGLGLLAPIQRTARVKKAALASLAYLNLVGVAGDTILLARRQQSDLERTLKAMTGLDCLHLALAPGAEGEFRKLTLRLMTGDGEAAGFAKVAVTAAAREAIAREAQMLKELAAYRELRGQVPALLGVEQAGGALVSVQSAGSGKVSASRFDSRHRQFLQTLAGITARRMVFRNSTMWQSLQTTYDLIAPRLSHEWIERLTVASAEVERSLGPVELTLAAAHRDFGPWNIRVQHDGRLFVFDWETAQPEMVPLYDYFDFHLRSHVLLGRQGEPSELARRWIAESCDWFPDIPTGLRPQLFLAYLLDRALNRSRYAVWRGEDKHDALRTLLGNLLDTRASWMRTG